MSTEKKEFIVLTPKKCRLIQSRRDELGLRLEDIADEFISTSTINAIEHGKRKVGKDRILHLANKLNLTDELFGIKSEEKLQVEELTEKLLLIEKFIFENPEIALQDLKKLKIKKYQPTYYLSEFLKGLYYVATAAWKKVDKQFLHVIDEMNDPDEMSDTNIIPASYYQLSRAAFHQNNFRKALKYANIGISFCDPDGTRPHYHYLLQVSKGIYLDKMDQTEDSVHTFESLYKEINILSSNQILSIGLTDVVLKMFNMYAYVLNKTKMYNKALTFANRGLEIAVIHGLSRNQYSLWDTLGNIHYAINNLTEAEKCYKMALNLEHKINQTHYIANTYTGLGKLYIKLGKYENAHDALEKAIKKSQDTNDAYCTIEAQMTYGDLSRNQKKYTEAIEAYQTALLKAQKYHLMSHQKKCIIWLGECWQHLGDKSKFILFLQELHRIEVSITLIEGGGEMSQGPEDP